MKWLLGGVAAALVLTAAGLASEGLLGPAVEPIYHTAAVDRGDITTTISASGTVRPVITVEVSSQISGQIAELLADFNDEVRKGQPIAKLDARTFEARVREAGAAVEVAEAGVLIKQAALEAAKADLANARARQSVVEAETASARAVAEGASREFERRELLRKRGGVISERDLDEVRAKRDSAAADLTAAVARETVHASQIATAAAGVRVAQAELENASALVRERKAALDEAEVELARTTIRAPIDGVVIGRDVDLGQTVAASLEAPTLFTIAQDLRRMEVHASIDEADIGRVRRDQHVTFTVDAYPQRSFEGSVVQIRKAPQVIQNVVVYTVVISAENPDLLLLPGMTATVTVQVSQVADTLRVPNAALRFEPPEGARVGEPRVQPGELSDGLPGFVWVLDGGMPVQVPIRVGAAERTASQVIAGTLSEADQVIVGYSIPDRGSNRFGLRLGF